MAQSTVRIKPAGKQLPAGRFVFAAGDNRCGVTLPAVNSAVRPPPNLLKQRCIKRLNVN
jgi:hypothetical protein